MSQCDEDRDAGPDERSLHVLDEEVDTDASPVSSVPTGSCSGGDGHRRGAGGVFVAQRHVELLFLGHVQPQDGVEPVEDTS